MCVSSKKGNSSIEIERSLCGNCGACVAVCPENVLHLTTVMLQVDNEGCTGCKFCIIVCPSDALKLVRSDGDNDE